MIIKAIAFDFGGVIEIGGKNPIEIASQILRVPINDLRKIYFKYNQLSNVENIPWEEMFTKVVAEFDDRKEAADVIKSTIQESLSQKKLNTELVALFPILRKQGLKVAIFSNATSNLREELRKYNLLDKVDEVIISGEIGFQKPHKEAFKVLFDRLQVHSHEAVFIDDSPKSLEKAEEIGYIPILYKNNEQLMADLQHLGIAVE